MKKLLLTAVLAASMGAMALSPQSAQAADGTITFKGAVTAATCSINVNGSTKADATVSLPNVDAGSLSAANATAGFTSFTIALSNCSANSGSQTKVVPYFEPGTTVDTTRGYLNNQDLTTAGGAGNVQVLLSTTSDVSGKIQLGANAANQNLTPVALSTNPTFTYYAAYIANGAATAGSVTTSVQYSLIYN